MLEYKFGRVGCQAEMHEPLDSTACASGISVELINRPAIRDARPRWTGYTAGLTR